jgi:hypothetical protein
MNRRAGEKAVEEIIFSYSGMFDDESNTKILPKFRTKQIS